MIFFVFFFIIFSFSNIDRRITQTSLDDVQQKYEDGEGELTGPRNNPLHFGADPDEGTNIYIFFFR